MSGAYVFAELQSRGYTNWVAFPAAIVAGALFGFVAQNPIMRLLRQASPLTRTVATLGILTALQAAAVLHYSSNALFASSFLPANVWSVGSVTIEADRVTLLAIAVALTAVLAAASRWTVLGLAMSGAAENERAASALGWSPGALATITWVAGGAIAGGAGALIAPIAGLDPVNLTLLVIPSLAAALLGGFSSFPVTLVGAVAIGIAQSLSIHYVTQTGFQDSVPFLVIIVVLVLTGRALPLRGHVTDRLPSVGTGLVRPLPVIAGTVLSIALMLWVFPVDWQDAFTVSFSWGVLLLSMVVLTGYAGQISLAQFALAGLGAFIAGRLVEGQGWPFWAAMVAGVVGTVAGGAVLALPALRTRGVTLAVVTLGLGFAVQRMVFENVAWTGGATGTNVGFVSFFGLDIDAIQHPARYGVFTIVVFLVCALAVANLRRSAHGRRLLAIRSNERAAASLGVSIVGAKVYAFCVAAAIAALAGILIGFRSTAIIYPNFSAVQSVYAIAFAVIGGVGYLLGPLFGAGFASGGYGVLFDKLLHGVDAYLILIGGIAVIVVLILNPDGIVPATLRQWRVPAQKLTPPWLRTRWEARGRIAAFTETARERVAPQALEVRSLGVRFGAVAAVDDVTFDVRPGEIVGLIGPNGAGKTTVIDAITGFVRPSAGTIGLGEQELGSLPAFRRARSGVARSWQSLELFEDVTVFENLLVAADRRRWWQGLSSLIYPGRASLSSAARAAADDFGLLDQLGRRAADLPYGQRRLAGIARAVALNPSVLLLDEPAAGLSPAETGELALLVRRLAAEWGMGILLVEHDVDLVLGVCDRVVVLNFGRVIADETPAEVRANPAVVLAYLGEASADAAELTGEPA
jgi:sulfate-transporting ATPase